MTIQRPQCEFWFPYFGSSFRPLPPLKMSVIKGRKWVLRSHFVGFPKREDFEIVEEVLPSIKDGGEGRRDPMMYMNSQYYS